MLALSIALVHMLAVPPIRVSPSTMSLKEAIEKSRTVGSKKIVLAPGVHYVSEPLILDHRDAGLTVAGESRDSSIVCAGTKLIKWERFKADIWSCNVPKGSDFRMLIVNGVPRDRSRLPETGKLKHKSVFDVPWMSTTGGGWKRKPTETELTTMLCDPKDLGEWLEPGNAEVTVFHMWDESCVGVKAYGPKTGQMVFDSPLGHPAGAFGVQDYVVWNTSKGLSKPGTWFLDKAGCKVYYWCKAGENLRTASVIAPRAHSAFFIGSGASNITLSNMTITGANTPLKATGFGAGEAEAAVRIEKADGCSLVNLNIAATSGAGIRAWASPQLKIGNCRIEYTGGCGIRSDCDGARISDNSVCQVGILYPSAAGIWATGKISVVEHNAISLTPYSAIIGGGENQLIEKNLISRCMLVMHDGAGIYAGFAKGMIFRGNVVRDIVDTGGYGASAYYLDEQATNCVVEGNLSVNVATPSQNHMAQGCTIRNNIFVSDLDMNLKFARCKGYTVEKNVLYAKGKIAFSYPEEGMSSFKDNIVYSLSGDYSLDLLDAMYSTKERRLLNRGGVFTNPRFINRAKEDFRFRSDSAALLKGIPSQQWADAGPRKQP